MPPLSYADRAVRARGRQVAGLILAALCALGLAGCPALMIPGLGYQAYKYEQGHKQSQTGGANATSTPQPSQFE